ncbi:hypothetical protein Y032_0006g3103 [Ancylostoma ceylanicum]|uniref:Uncharacterized protein n=1 Tax=Ancylostoma ceylanicum TaxID=53326 RepID=A0A016VQG7_9BILA|nr:hypothetical protein Y032_0006g3103 [Ancylostoma ceylanicum]
MSTLLFWCEPYTNRTQQQLTSPRARIQLLDYLNQENSVYAQKFEDALDPASLVCPCEIMWNILTYQVDGINPLQFICWGD